MKKLLKVIVVLAAVLMLTTLALQLFLNHGLNPIIHKALPKASEALGVDIGVGDASLNLFAGSLAVKDISIGNPDAFEEPTVFALKSTVMDVSLRALTDGILEVSEASVTDAKLTLVRNREGDINLNTIQEALPKSEAADKPAPAAKETDATPSEPFVMPKAQLNNLAFKTQFEFIDHKTTNPAPTHVAFDLTVKASDVATFGTRPEADWGTLVIQGNLADAPDAFVTDITARIAPLSDLAKASFTAHGNIVSINMRELGDALTDEAGIASDSADIALRLNVRDGAFAKGSDLVITLREAELVGDLKAQYDDVTLPPDISLTLPISGTLAKPRVYIHQAITASVLQNLVKNPDYILDNVTVGGKSLRTRLSDALGGGEANGGGTNAVGDTKLEETVNDAFKKLGDLFK